MMTDRQREILYAIIEEYAEMATPVGSVTLAKLFDVSSATIRAEMSRLEDRVNNNLIYYRMNYLALYALMLVIIA